MTTSQLSLPPNEKKLEELYQLIGSYLSDSTEVLC